ncbi:MAG: PTH1 family peptidyl-tRNA hydrolase [Hyphomicrobiaceae bacterium]|jgi:PTH1 family peptidyl-tRNA hydrolase
MTAMAAMASDFTLCVVGLGNPGEQYHHTRHNIGFELIDELARRAGADIRRKECLSLTVETEIRCTMVLLMKPQTFMNKSGLAVRELCDAHPLPMDRLVVAYDDLDLPLGRLRVRQGGGSGGHRGVASIMENLETSDFVRIRMGVGRPPEGVDTIEHVLGSFSDDEQGVARPLVERAAEAIEALCEHDVLAVMNRFNRNDTNSPA